MQAITFSPTPHRAELPEEQRTRARRLDEDHPEQVHVSLTDLPDEILRQCIIHCDPSTFVTFSGASQRIRRLCKSTLHTVIAPLLKAT